MPVLRGARHSQSTRQDALREPQKSCKFSKSTVAEISPLFYLSQHRTDALCKINLPLDEAHRKKKIVASASQVRNMRILRTCSDQDLDLHVCLQRNLSIFPSNFLHKISQVEARWNQTSSSTKQHGVTSFKESQTTHLCLFDQSEWPCCLHAIQCDLIKALVSSPRREFTNDIYPCSKWHRKISKPGHFGAIVALS